MIALRLITALICAWAALVFMLWGLREIACWAHRERKVNGITGRWIALLSLGPVFCLGELHVLEAMLLPPTGDVMLCGVPLVQSVRTFFAAALLIVLVIVAGEYGKQKGNRQVLLVIGLGLLLVPALLIVSRYYGV